MRAFVRCESSQKLNKSKALHILDYTMWITFFIHCRRFLFFPLYIFQKHFSHVQHFYSLLLILRVSRIVFSLHTESDRQEHDKTEEMWINTQSHLGIFTALLNIFAYLMKFSTPWMTYMNFRLALNSVNLICDEALAPPCGAWALFREHRANFVRL